MDGTLLDTERLIIAAWHRASLEHGLKTPDELLEYVIGCSADTTRRHIMAWLNSEQLFASIMGRCRELFQATVDADGVSVKPGARELLDYLKANDIPVAIATSSRRDSAMARLSRAGVSSHFQVVVACNGNLPPKPAPDGYLEAASQLGLNASEAVWAIEDSTDGIRAAYAAGLRVIHIPDIQRISAEILGVVSAVYSDMHALLAASRHS